MFTLVALTGDLLQGRRAGFSAIEGFLDDFACPFLDAAAALLAAFAPFIPDVGDDTVNSWKDEIVIIQRKAQ